MPKVPTSASEAGKGERSKVKSCFFHLSLLIKKKATFGDVAGLLFHGYGEDGTDKGYGRCEPENSIKLNDGDFRSVGYFKRIIPAFYKIFRVRTNHTANVICQLQTQENCKAVLKMIFYDKVAGACAPNDERL